MQDRRHRGPRGEGRSEAGFLLIEHIVAVVVLFGVLLTLLAVLGAGSRGVLNGRQRTVAVSLAKQVIENLQGSAYANVSMNLSSPGLSTDTRVTGTAPVLYFEGEQLVGGGSGSYRTTTTLSGATYTLSTYITAVIPTSGLPYRRVTVIVEWTPSNSGGFFSLRFSSLVYPLDFSSYPSGSGLAEATGARVDVAGVLGGQSIDGLHVQLPAARTTSLSSTLRSVQALGSGPAIRLDSGNGASVSGACTASGGGVECPALVVSQLADNDDGTTASTQGASANVAYPNLSVSKSSSLDVETPSGTASARASVATCSGCAFGDGDGLPWSDSSSAALGPVLGTYQSPVLSGKLWSIDSGWATSAALDHDPTGGGSVQAQAGLTAPAAKVLTIQNTSSSTFDAAVMVDAFSVSASAAVGSALAAPVLSMPLVRVRMWDDASSGYKTLQVDPAAATDVTTTGTVVVAGQVVTITSHVASQAKAVTAAGSAPRTIQLPQVMLIEVTATVGSDIVSVTLDYGVVTAHADWEVKT